MKIKFLSFWLILFLYSFVYSQETELNILTWNIQMLPNGPSIFSKDLRKLQKVRLSKIIEHCNSAEYDIIVFQEVFDRELRRKLVRKLQKVYPYQIKTKTKFGRLTSNGVLIVSKVPLRYLDHVIYKKGVTADAMAAKGCTLIEAEKNGVIFQIAGTHLQAGNSDEAIKHRYSQYQEIANLIHKYKIDTIPIFVIGDLNTKKSDTKVYQDMLKIIDVQDFPINDPEPFTIDGKNSWNNHSNGIQLDYILLNPRKTSTQIIEQKILRLKFNYKKKNIDLSDHYGVKSKIIIKK
ncbi:MAG: hypothetical protein C0596_04545 [Marinilabiliales bacterium]|nr:MAG: hypothetical protein C0596_04545 [Marinilabiliales bacterium]